MQQDKQEQEEMGTRYIGVTLMEDGVVYEMQEVVASNTTGIVESVTQFQKDAVIDEYTQQLIEEGLI